MKNDSIWAVVAGVCKNLTLTPDYVLHEMSYTNIMMYSSVLPSYEDYKNSKQSDRPKFDASKDANNPDLFNNSDQDEVVVKRR